MKKTLLSIITLLFLSQLAFSQQQALSGLKINKPTSWSGTVIVEGDITVMKNGVLTIEAGTKVLFSPKMDKTNSGKDKTRCELIVKGSLIVRGAGDRKVVFSSNSKSPRMGDWYGISIGNPKQPSVIDNAVIEYAYNGIMVKKSNPVIKNSQISLNYNAGILCEVKSKPRISKNIISENGYGGIICGLGAKPILSHNLISLNEIGVVALSLSQPNLGNLKKGKDYNEGQNNIFENTEYDLYNHTNLPLFAENNSWGSNRNLDARIYDSGEDSQYGIVDVQPIYRQANLDELIFLAQETQETLLAENTASSEQEGTAQNQEPQAAKIQQDNSTAPAAAPLLAASNTAANTPAGNISGNSDNAEAKAEEKKPEEIIKPPVNTSTASERPLATLEQKPVKPQINYDQIFLEHFLDSRKKILKKVSPKVKSFGPKGRVIIRATIGRDGKVESAKIVKGLSEHYDEISVTAAEQFVFTAGKVKGVPVKFYTNIMFEF